MRWKWTEGDSSEELNNSTKWRGNMEMRKESVQDRAGKKS